MTSDFEPQARHYAHSAPKGHAGRVVMQVITPNQNKLPDP